MRSRRWLLRGAALLLLAPFVWWFGLALAFREQAGDTSLWQLAFFIAQQNLGSLRCVLTGCAPELPEGLALQRFADEKLLASVPVALDVDEQGRVYVAEADRIHGGVEDNRKQRYWLADELASHSVGERRAYYEKWLAAGKFEDPEHFTRRADRVLVLEDADGDGSADRARELARFSDSVDGLVAGVLAHEGDLYVTEIPALYRLRGINGESAPQIETLARGFGVKTSLAGHDLHGLVRGADGKLYFSVGDRGYQVTTREGQRLEPPLDPGRGAVFRINLDGSGLEVVATGLRNPQELAFDDLGNLFTGDNNSDGGDRARIVYVVEGGDSGWLMPFQSMTGEYLRGAWNAEKLWQLAHPDQPAWIVPPVAHLASGPAGLAAYPGLGLPERYRGHLLLCDYRYSIAASGIWSFALEPEGAGFRLRDAHAFARNLLATDLAFGYDGRIFATLFDEVGQSQSVAVIVPAAPSPELAVVTRLVREGMSGRKAEELADLLGHADRRVRLRAQWELARRGDAAPLARVAADASRDRLARVHAVWGLGQLGAGALRAAGWTDLAWTHAEDPEVRAQVAKISGDAGADWLVPELIRLLSDESLRVRFFAAQSLGKLGARDALAALLALLRENADRDPFLRHAAAYALYRIGDLDALWVAAGDASPAVRMGVLLALRRAADPRIARFLSDPEPRLVVEAARAIADVPIAPALPALSTLAGAALPRADDPQSSFALHRRAIEASLVLGTREAALALAAHAANRANPRAMRLLALDALAQFAKPEPREGVLGRWRPLAPRDPAAVHAALEQHGAALVAGDLGGRALEVTLVHDRVPLATVDLLARVQSTLVESRLRVASLRALLRRGAESSELRTALAVAARSEDAMLRAEARDLLAELRPAEALPGLARARYRGAALERQRGFAALARISAPAADALLGESLGRLEAGQLDPAVALDLLEALRARGNPQLAARAAAWQAALPGHDAAASRPWALEGGDPARGREVFRGAGDCQRCHEEGGHAAGAGPELTWIGWRRDRVELLRSVVDPQAEIADGFGPASAMPPVGLALAPRELRDLVAYLDSL